MAGLTHADQGLTFEAAYDLLGGLDPADLHEWEEDLFQQTGQCLRFATREVSVVDTPEGGVCFRSLHFNDRFDVVQTCIALDAATGGPDHSLPPSLDSQAGTATQGLSLAVALHQISRGGDAAGGGRRIAVLGAGACSLPAFLHDALPGATIDAVELSPDVCAAARACFGVSALEGSARFTLHEACAFVWLAAAPPRSLDLIIVDMEAGEAALAAPWAQLPPAEQQAMVARGMALPLVAPPPRALEPEFAAACRAALAPGGVLALNALGGEAAVARAAAAVGAGATCAPPPPSAEEAPPLAGGLVQRMLFSGGPSPPPRRQEVRKALRALPALLSDADAWLDSWTLT